MTTPNPQITAVLNACLPMYSDDDEKKCVAAIGALIAPDYAAFAEWESANPAKIAQATEEWCDVVAQEFTGKGDDEAVKGLQKFSKVWKSDISPALAQACSGTKNGVVTSAQFAQMPGRIAEKFFLSELNRPERFIVKHRLWIAIAIVVIILALVGYIVC
jgi:hypothetical protein